MALSVAIHYLNVGHVDVTYANVPYKMYVNSMYGRRFTFWRYTGDLFTTLVVKFFSVKSCAGVS